MSGRSDCKMDTSASTGEPSSSTEHRARPSSGGRSEASDDSYPPNPHWLSQSLGQSNASSPVESQGTAATATPTTSEAGSGDSPKSRGFRMSLRAAGPSPASPLTSRSPLPRQLSANRKRMSLGYVVSPSPSPSSNQSQMEPLKSETPPTPESLLADIARRERHIGELKELLRREEEELEKLRKQWQAAQPHHERPSSDHNTGHEALPNGVTDAIRAMGWGAILDGQAALKSVEEKAEEEESEAIQSSSSKSATTAVKGAKVDHWAAGSAWASTWSKRIREAAQHAEKALGEAMAAGTMPSANDENQRTAATSSRSTSTKTASKSPPLRSKDRWQDENNREKSALAELGWLSNLPQKLSPGQERKPRTPSPG